VRKQDRDRAIGAVRISLKRFSSDLSHPSSRVLSLRSCRITRPEKRPEIINRRSIATSTTRHSRWRSWENVVCFGLFLSRSLSSSLLRAASARNRTVSLSRSALALFTHARQRIHVYTSTRCHSHHKGLRAPINSNYSYECCRPAAVTRRKVRPVHKLCRAGRTEFSMQFE